MLHPLTLAVLDNQLEPAFPVLPSLPTWRMLHHLRMSAMLTLRRSIKQGDRSQQRAGLVTLGHIPIKGIPKLAVL